MSEAGFTAAFPDECPRCPEPIEPGSRVIRHGYRLIHVGCASGQDDQ